ncbi:MAG: glycosyltransferase [Candidatus Cloacimonetes bacterium]|nr:glycosyltransferase [Candidatus Cloacimonadota bacterium]
MSSSRPSLLFIARSFPPVANIATIRMASIARHLARCGWKITVLAPHPDLLRDSSNREAAVEFCRQEGIQLIPTGYDWRSLVPGLLRQRPGLPGIFGGIARRVARWLDIDDGAGWIRPILNATKHLPAGSIDLVLASGSPFASFEAARRLARRLRCPFVLDYRDPWTLRDFRTVPVRPWTVRKERRVCQEAAAILHVSPMLVPIHVSAFGGAERNHALTNGFDPEMLDPVPAREFEHPAIVYAGRFYPPHRVIQPVLEAVRMLHEEPGGQWTDLRFHYYGVDSGQVRQAAAACGAEGLLVDHGKVPQAESFAASKGAAVNVVVTSVLKSVDQGILGNLPGKLFEVIGLGSPVLLVSPDGSQARRILEQTGSGIGVSGETPVRIVEALKQLLDRPAGRGPGANAYSWPQLGRQLDTLLRSLLPAGVGR